MRVDTFHPAHPSPPSPRNSFQHYHTQLIHPPPHSFLINTLRSSATHQSFEISFVPPSPQSHDHNHTISFFFLFLFFFFFFNNLTSSHHTLHPYGILHTMLFCHLFTVAIAWFIGMPAALMWLNKNGMGVNRHQPLVETIDPPNEESQWLLNRVRWSNQAVLLCDAWASDVCRAREWQADERVWVWSGQNTEMIWVEELMRAEDDVIDWKEDVASELDLAEFAVILGGKRPTRCLHSVAPFRIPLASPVEALEGVYFCAYVIGYNIRKLQDERLYDLFSVYIEDSLIERLTAEGTPYHELLHGWEKLQEAMVELDEIMDARVVDAGQEVKGASVGSDGKERTDSADLVSTTQPKPEQTTASTRTAPARTTTTNPRPDPGPAFTPHPLYPTADRPIEDYLAAGWKISRGGGHVEAWKWEDLAEALDLEGESGVRAGRDRKRVARSGSLMAVYYYCG